MRIRALNQPETTGVYRRRVDTAENIHAQNHRDWLTKSGWQRRKKSQILAINRVRVLGSGPHTPYPSFLGVHPRDSVLLANIEASDPSNIHQGSKTHQCFDTRRMII